LWVWAGGLDTVDISTGNVTEVGFAPPGFLDIAFAPNGTLYGINELGLYTINTSTGGDSFVGATSPQITEIGFAPDGTLFGIAFRTPDHVILQIEDRVRAMPVFRHPFIVEGVERAAESGPPERRWD